MEEKIIQITSGKGPAECERVVYLVLQKMKKELEERGISFLAIVGVDGKQDDTLLSVMLRISGNGVLQFCKEWQGTVQWIAQSPFRRFHKRKNWFVGIVSYDIPLKVNFSEADVIFQTTRASGPGGQHVNKVESAVRAIHEPSGIAVTVASERSQLMNKKAAVERLKMKLICRDLEQKAQDERAQWMQHNELIRGNPVKTFREPMD